MTAARALGRLALLLGLALLPPSAAAQEGESGLLETFVESRLSAAGREVTITGFSGALSSQARMDQMTIADAQGVWITLSGISLDWSRTALLAGRLEIAALTAQEIAVIRLPDGGQANLEGAEFALPDLPVSIEIGRIAADRIVLAPAVLGQSVTGWAEASASYGETGLTFDLQLERTGEGPAGTLSLQADYDAAQGILTAALQAREDAGGIAARLLGIPNAPATELRISGSGPVDRFAADLALETGGLRRLGGTLTLLGRQGGGQDFALDLTGDLAPLVQPQYRALLGDQVSLSAQGARLSDGRTRLDNLALTAGAGHLRGSLALAPDGLPEAFRLNLGFDGKGGTVALPVPGLGAARLNSARLDLGFDAARSQEWTLGGLILAPSSAQGKADSLSLSGSGTIARGAQGRRVTGKASLLGLGFAPSDPALARALGRQIVGAITASWDEGSGFLAVQDLTLSGSVYDLQGAGTIGGLAGGFAVKGDLRASLGDLSLLSGLAGTPLSGSASLQTEGSASLLGSAFDIGFRAGASDLGTGNPRLDRLLTGPSLLEGRLRRDAGGTEVQGLTLRAGGISARLAGNLTRERILLTGDLALPDLAALGPGLAGAVQGKAVYSGDLSAGILSLQGQGAGLATGQPQLDRLLAGEARFSAALDLAQGAVRLRSAALQAPALGITAQGEPGGALQISARLNDLGLVLPDFPGALTLSGPLRQTQGGLEIDLALEGPAQVRGRLSGSLSQRRADLTFSGQSLAAVLNPFLAPRYVSGLLRYDLRLMGPLALASLVGRVDLEGGQLADPDLLFGLNAISAQMNLAGGQAQLAASAQVSSGGALEMTGQAQAAYPFAGALDIALRGVKLRQPRLYEVAMDGDLTLRGPLAGGAEVSGAITLNRAELQVPTSALGGFEPIPQIRHLAEPAGVLATRRRAGLTGDVAQSAAISASYPLSITVSAPNRVFVRGRGIDAELGGRLTLRGTTDDFRPEGAFDLIRGRMDLVGRRLTLTGAQLFLQGDTMPRIDITAALADSDIVSTIRLHGPADDPSLTLSSSPARPDEEILAQLLFGKTLQSLSPVQAAQLAAAVGTLAGRGGEGLAGRIRRKSGLDNLDIVAGQDGGGALTAGKYLSDKVYSEVTVEQSGKTRIELNLDLKPHITLKGSAESDGSSGLGIFLEKNY